MPPSSGGRQERARVLLAAPVKPLPVSFYRRPCEEVAADLLGRDVVRRLDGERLVARIVETEAYLGEGDRASHAWHGRVTRRNAALFRPGGCAYVFFIYGMYYCLNAVTGGAGEGTAVLIRAAEPLGGLETMAARRRLRRAPRPGDLTGGPGKLCQALAIDRAFDGAPLGSGELRIVAGEPVARASIAVGPRVGIDYAGEAAAWPLRFAVRDNDHVSRPRL